MVCPTQRVVIRQRSHLAIMDRVGSPWFYTRLALDTGCVADSAASFDAGAYRCTFSRPRVLVHTMEPYGESTPGCARRRRYLQSHPFPSMGRFLGSSISEAFSFGSRRSRPPSPRAMDTARYLSRRKPQTSCPCVDCGTMTEWFCDWCPANRRLPPEIWRPGLPPGLNTPLCEYCDSVWMRCRFCRVETGGACATGARKGNRKGSNSEL